MDESQFHDHMSQLYAAQRAQYERASSGVTPGDWKNRHRIAAKLKSDNYADLMAFCRQNGLSVNSAINLILHKHFASHV